MSTQPSVTKTTTRAILTPTPPRRREHPLVLVLSAVLGILLGLAIVGVVLWGASQAHASPAAPSPIGGAVLGSPASAFSARYGAPDGDGLLHTSVNGTPVELHLLVYSAVETLPYHVNLVQVERPGFAGTVPASAADSLIAQLLPADAVLTQTYPSGAQVYTSKSLAQAFPAAAFTTTTLTSDGSIAPAPAAPGTLTVMRYGSATAGYSKILVTLGTP